MRWPVLLTIIATLALAAVAAGCGGDGGSGSSEDAEALLDKAFSQEVKSADLKIDMSADLEGVQQLSGPLRSNDRRPLQVARQEEAAAFRLGRERPGRRPELLGGPRGHRRQRLRRVPGHQLRGWHRALYELTSQVEAQMRRAPRASRPSVWTCIVAGRSRGGRRPGDRRRFHPGDHRRRECGARGEGLLRGAEVAGDKPSSRPRVSPPRR